ncbi:MAG TPA: IclR family transcriptional regulator [Acidimicrobiales bacterium]|nr:IclR family transcriptional regulator [Acidimicrobiales bacterium]
MVEQVGERTGARAVERAIEVIDCFGNDEPELSLSQLARRAGLPVSTTHRITQALVRGGLLERSGRDRYRVGQRLAGLAGPVLSRLGVDEAAPSLHKLAEGLRLTASVGVLGEGQVLTVFSVRPSLGFHPTQVPSQREPLHASAMGKALLAFAPGEPRAGVERLGRLPRFTARTHTSPAELITDLEQIRRRGFAVSDGERTEGVRSVAVPLFGSRHQPWGALGVQERSTRLADDRLAQIAPALRHIGAEIGQRVKRSEASHP